MRVHFVVLGGSEIASTRVRALSLANELAKLGHRVSAARARTARTLWRVVPGVRTDVIVLQKIVPPARLVSQLKRRCRVLVLDLDDAIYLGYPGSNELPLSRGRDLASVGEFVDLLTTPSPLIASDLIPWFRRTLVHPGPAPDVERTAGDLWSRKTRPAVLWLGSGSTAPELKVLRPSNDILSSILGGATAVGAPIDPLLTGMRFVPWSMPNQAKYLETATSGLIPLRRSPWNDRKAAYKALEYAAWGVVPIASDSPAIDAIGPVRDLCTVVDTDSDWAQALVDAAHSVPERVEIEALTNAAREVGAPAYAKKWVAAIEALLCDD